jgi:Ca-activated chloride channel family protein
MQATDIAPNRLQRAALELHEFLSLAQGSRVGIVVYGARPHLFAPLTNDANAVRFYLQHLQTLVLPTHGTDHAAALGFAQQELAAREQVLPAAVLWITDGDIPPNQHAALQTRVQALQAAGIPLYSLGVGTEDGEAIPLPGGKWLEHDGQAVRSRLDSTLLQSLTAQAGGAYSTVKDDASDWETLYTNGIAQAFPATANDTQQWRELYVWVLLLGMVCVWLAVWRKSPLTPLLQRGEQEVRNIPASPFAKGGLRGIFFLCFLSTFSDPSQADETDLNNGIEAYRTEHYATATQHFTAAAFAATNDTERARALHNLGNSYFQQGDYAAAAQVFQIGRAHV